MIYSELCAFSGVMEIMARMVTLGYSGQKKETFPIKLRYVV